MKRFLKAFLGLLLLAGCANGQSKVEKFDGVKTTDKGDGIVLIENGEWKENTKYRVSVNYTLSDGTIHPTRFHMNYITLNRNFEVYVPEGQKYGIILSECSEWDSCAVYTDIDKVVIESSNYSSDPEVKAFLVEDIWNREEAEAKYAVELCEGLNTDYEKLEKIYYYITEEYDYDMSIYDPVVGEARMNKVASETALETFESKSGICQDFSRLLIAMCRAVDIPVTGVTGVGSNGGYVANAANQGHQWNRVYVDGEWHIVDATWGLVSSIGKHRDPYVEGDELKDYITIDDNEY